MSSDASVVSTLCNPMDTTEPARLPFPWDSPGKNTGVGCHALLQVIFPTQGLNRHHMSPALAGGFFTTRIMWEAPSCHHKSISSQALWSMDWNALKPWEWSKAKLHFNDFRTILALEWVLLELPVICLERLVIPYPSWFMAKCFRFTGVFPCLKFTESSPG